MEVTTARPGYELWRPNRQSAEAETTKAIVALVLLGARDRDHDRGLAAAGGTSVALMSLLWAVLYIVFAVRHAGILPVASALAIILAIFAANQAAAGSPRRSRG